MQMNAINNTYSCRGILVTSVYTLSVDNAFYAFTCYVVIWFRSHFYQTILMFQFNCYDIILFFTLTENNLNSWLMFLSLVMWKTPNTFISILKTRIVSDPLILFVSLRFVYIIIIYFSIYFLWSIAMQVIPTYINQSRPLITDGVNLMFWTRFNRWKKQDISFSYMLSDKQGSIWYHFYNVFSMTRSGLAPTTYRSRGERANTKPPRRENKLQWIILFV